ncbi:MAG: hypothetical protein UU66_C0047G0004 [Parcubacteria group bacterium GW2011_GWB1_41_5]|nr:MAG: hypothetical protein UU66_C0047G0004 [Parcubacteria group bacterium GW2011_GWB1_41_5]
MNEPSKPEIKKSGGFSCSYCGDAPINHLLSFLESIFSVTLDNHAKKFFKYVPRFVKDFVDLVPEFLFRTLAFFKLVEFSPFIDKAYTFRSRIIWEEAKRRGIVMEQVIFRSRPLDYYRAILNGKFFYFESIPIQSEFLDTAQNWDDKVILKGELKKHHIPIPDYCELSFFGFKKNTEKIFSKLARYNKTLIVKPRVGSRGRHTITNIHTLEQFQAGINVAGEICSYLIAEEYLSGSVCRATLVSGMLAGFYRGQAPTLVGDGHQTIQELIDKKDKKRRNRVEPIRLGQELHDHVGRFGFKLQDILGAGVTLPLSHRIGRLFGGETEEMIDNLHPSFIPIFERAAKVLDLSVVGFDAIIPDPTKEASSQKWGIIECNTLPFIDLHYFALKGKPRNIAGMIWDNFFNAPR